MHRIKSDHGVTISYDKHGSGPPLVLVHGSFSDHRTNWEFVLPFLSRQFTVYAIARRGRGETDKTKDHQIGDEALDAAALIQTIGEPVFLLGHSYGAHVALAAALLVPDKIRKLVLYEAPWPGILGGKMPDTLEKYAHDGDWDAFSFWFFANALFVPAEELEALRHTALWPPILEDAPASYGDLRSLSQYDFVSERFAGLSMPVLLQIGSESPRRLFTTDALSRVLKDVRIGSLDGQAHEGMTTAASMYADAVMTFLSGGAQQSQVSGGASAAMSSRGAR